MSRLKSVAVVAVTIAVMATGVIGAPVAGADQGKVAFINGWPGKRVDICVNGKEVKSALPYGKQVFRKFAPGKKNIKIFKKDPRTCRGTRLAQRSVDLLSGGDLSVVATSGTARVQVFDNAGYGVTPAATIAVVFRSAANFPATIKWFGTATPTPFTPAADPVWGKGDETALVGSATPDYLLTVLATEPDSPLAIAGPVSVQYPSVDQVRMELYLLGNSPANARMLVLRRMVSFP